MGDYWKTPEDMGLTEEQITEKLDELWADANKTATKHCHDCNAAPGEFHLSGCDTARCATCGGQALSCDCDDVGEDVWTGLWPGTKECYELRLLTWSDPTRDFGTGWMFNYNALAMRQKD